MSTSLTVRAAVATRPPVHGRLKPQRLQWCATQAATALHDHQHDAANIGCAANPIRCHSCRTTSRPNIKRNSSLRETSSSPDSQWWAQALYTVYCSNGCCHSHALMPPAIMKSASKCLADSIKCFFPLETSVVSAAGVHASCNTRCRMKMLPAETGLHNRPYGFLKA
jgi:hypothetical protein